MYNLMLVASGTKIGVGDAFLTAIVGYAVVFVGLLLLMVVVVIMGAIFKARAAKAAAAAGSGASAAQEAPAPAPVGKPAPGSAGEVKLYNVPDREAAMVMAVVADTMGKPINELRFKSIKEVK